MRWSSSTEFSSAVLRITVSRAWISGPSGKAEASSFSAIRPSIQSPGTVIESSSSDSVSSLTLWLVSELFEEQFATVLPAQDLPAGQLAGADGLGTGRGRGPERLPDARPAPGLQHLELLGQFGQQRLVVENVRVWVEGREGVEEEGGELGGEAGPGRPLPRVGHRQAQRELGRRDVRAGHVAAGVVASAIQNNLGKNWRVGSTESTEHIGFSQRTGEMICERSLDN